MSELDRLAPDIDDRIELVVRAAVDVRPIADVLARRRSDIVAGWLVAARSQPFHADKPERAVADHLPALLDALVDVLQRSGVDGTAEAPLEDRAVVRAATQHARARFEEGLGPVAVVTEFRLLRQEISRALIEDARDAPAADLLAGQALIDDALDGACTVGLDALSTQIETLRDEFLATTLHDIRQPITLVTGSLDLASRWLREATPSTDRVAEVVDDAVVAVSEINSMLDTLGDATKVAMGSVETETEPASLEAIVSDAIALLGSEGRSRIRVSAPDGPRLIGEWDPSQIRRVVGNVVGNALKYSPDGGPIEVELARVSDKARLVVRDQGMGFTADEREAMFGRFIRAERARARGIPGLGLGLYATRGMVEAHGGRIAIRSDGPGTGATVEIELPLLLEHEDA